MKAEWYKQSGLLAFIIAWVGMLSVVATQGRHKYRSISFHAASSKKTFILLAVLSPISMSLLSVFTLLWMVPMFNLSMIFSVLSIMAFAGYILAAWVPAGDGVKGDLHDIFAYGASLLLIPISLILVSSPSIAPLARIINAMAVLLMIGIFALLLWYKPARNNYLYYQIAYFLVFDLSLLAAGYIQL